MPLAIVLVLAVVAGAYFYITSENRKIREQKFKAEEIRQELVQVRAKADVETAKLDNFKKKFRDQFPFHAVVSDEYDKIAGAISKVDALFDSSDGSAPKIKIKTKTVAVEADINSRWANIKTLLNEWKKKASISLAQEADKNTIIQIKKDAQVIQSFVNELASIVNALTPEDSGLTQSQIDNFEATLAAVSQEISGTIASLTQAESIVPVTSGQTTQTTQTTSTQPPVTAEEIITQQAIVAEIQAQIVVLEQQLAQIVAVITSTTGITPLQEVVQVETTVVNTSNPNPTSSGVSFPDTIVDPNSPQLIQGS